MAKKRKASKSMGQGNIAKTATVGKQDKSKTRLAKKIEATMGQFGNNGGFFGSAYATSYSNSGMSAGAFGDIPLYFALMNENNGGLLYWPVNLKEKYSWYRYWARSDAFVGKAIELHTELPLSKLMLRMPVMKDTERREMIRKRYEKVIVDLDLFKKLPGFLREFFILGNLFCFVEWDGDKKEFTKLSVLPPEDVMVTRYPMSDHSRIEYKPEMIMTILNKLKGNYGSFEDFINAGDAGLLTLDEEEKKIYDNIPKDMLTHIYQNGTIVMDTDPYSDGEIGSFVHHMAREKSEYMDLGISMLERILVPMLMKFHYQYTQLSLASRNMTPRNKISAECTPEALEELREQIDLSMMNPDYSIVTNYKWDWDQIGADNRLIDLSKEYESIQEHMYAGLGVTKELLTGEGQFGGSRINLEILNTRYLLLRETLIDFIEKKIFEPIAEANGFFEVDKNGFKTYLYPKLSFSRLSIRDNEEVFSDLFQLYSKGSLPVDYIYDLLNLDPQEMSEQIKEDLFTVKDPTFNDMIRMTYNDISSELSVKSDLGKQIVDSLTGPEGEKLTYTDDEDEGYDEGIDEETGEETDADDDSWLDAWDGTFGDDAFDDKDDEKTEQEKFEEDIEDNDTIKELNIDLLSDDITNNIEIPKGTTKHDIEKVIQELKKSSNDPSNDLSNNSDEYINEIMKNLTLPIGTTKADIKKVIQEMKNKN